MTARTPETEQAYQEARAKGDLVDLVDEPAIKDFHCWKLIDNRFPHDKFNEIHHLLVLKRPTQPDRVSMHELEELWKQILPQMERDFHYMKFNFSSLRSVNKHVHLHICKYLPEYV